MVIPISLDFANQDTYPQDMKSLTDSLRKSLAHRHMGHQMVRAVALNVARAILGIPELEGYVRFNVFFLKISDQALKIKIFQQKNQILHEVNLALEKIGYATRVEEIRMK